MCVYCERASESEWEGGGVDASLVHVPFGAKGMKHAILHILVLFSGL